MADRSVEETPKHLRTEAEYNLAKEFLLHEEHLLVQRFSTYLLATSILFLGFASMVSIGRELHHLNCLKGSICSVGILGSVFLIGNMVRAGRARDYWRDKLECFRKRSGLSQELSWDELKEHQRAGHLGRIFGWSGGSLVIVLSLVFFLALWVLSLHGVIWGIW